MTPETRTRRADPRTETLLARAGRKRWVRVTLRVVLALVVARIALALAMPFTLNQIAKTRGLECKYRDLTLSLATGKLQVRGLTLRERGAPASVEPLLESEFLGADVAMWKTITGDPTVSRVEVDGLRARVEREADGRTNWERLFASGEAQEPEPEDEREEPEPIDFTSPVQVEALRLHAIAVHVVDAHAEPPLDARIDVDARLSSADREHHVLELRAESPELFDRGRVDAEIAGSLRTLRGEIALEISGVRTERMRQQLESLGIVASELGARCAIDVEASPREGSEVDCRARVRVHDTALDAGGELVAALDELDLQLASLRLEPAAKSTLVIAARAPGVAESIRCDGELDLAWPRVAAALALRADGVAPTRLAKTLRDAGFEPELARGALAAQLDATATLGDAGRVDADATLANLVWSDASELAAVERVAVRGIAIDPAQQLVRVASVDVAGVRARANRDANGVVHALGFALVPAAQPAEQSPAPSATAAGEPQRFELGNLNWHDNAFAFTDASLQPPLELSIEGFAVEVESLAIGGPSAAPGKLRARASVAGLVESLALEGTLAAPPGSCDAKLALRGEGIDTRSAKASLAALGLEPTLERGSLSADLAVSSRTESGVLVVSCELANVALSDGGRELAALDRLRIHEATLGAEETHVRGIEVDGVRAALARDSSGALNALGVRITGAPQRAPAEPQPADPWAAAFAAFEPLPPLPATLDALDVRNVRVSWRDDALAPPIECALELEAHASDLSSKSGSAVSHFDLVARVPESLDELAWQSTLALTPENTYVGASLDVRGVRAGALAAYAPRGLECELADGRLHAQLVAELARGGAGERKARVQVAELRWSDGERELFGVDALNLVARAVPEQRAIEVGEVSLRGVRLDVERSTPTTWRALGLAIDTAAPSAPETAAPATAPRAKGPRTGASPTLALGVLDLELARLAVIDRSGGAAAPLVASARLSTPAPMTLLAPDPRELPPLALELRASVEPVVRAIALDLRATPFGDPLEVDLAAAVRGIDGAQLALVAPELAAGLDARAFQNGELTAHARAQIELERSRPDALELSKPWRGEVVLDGLALRAAPEGEVLAGLQEARAEIARYDPATGDLHLRALELERPIGRVRWTADGLEVCGLMFKTSADEGEAARPAAVAIEASAPRPAASDAKPAPELRIDRAGISGVDLVARDESVDPPVELAFDALELDARKISTRALAQGQPIAFSASLGARKQRFAVRDDADSVLTGFFGATADVIAGESDGPLALEERAPFGEIALAGKLAFEPELEGWATLDVEGFELAAVRGLARSSGLEIGDGVLDQTLRLRFRGARGTSVESRSTFQHLSLSEPAGGPIERYLSLPAPLDTVLFLLKDYEGEHKVPVSFRIDESGTSGIGSAAAGAAARVIASAIASSPLRIASTLTGAVGLSGGDEAKPGKKATAIAFESGATALDARERAAIAEMRRLLGDDEEWVAVLTHEFSRADLARAAELGSPALDDCRELSLRLRNKRSQLTRERDELAARARVAYAVGDRDAAAKLGERVKGVESELGLTEDALDRVHELLKPNAERKREQRTRLAAYAIASDRVSRVRQALIDAGIPPKRIEVRQVRVRASEAEAGRVLMERRERR